MLTHVVDGVQVRRSELLRNNTVVVDGPDGVLLVDPGITEGELLDLAAVLRESGRVVEAGFATHPDWDHALWHAELGDAPRYGTEQCAADLQELLATAGWQQRVAEAMPPEIIDETPLELFGRITALPVGATTLPWSGPGVRVIEHRAHSSGHAALLLEGSRVLIAGDMLSDVFPPMLDLSADDPLGDYLAALDLFDAVAAEVDVVIPGHGSVGTDVRTRIAQDRAYVLALREGGDPADSRILSPEPGWEWVAGIHDWQVQSLRGGPVGGPPGE
ncbi:MBL fold metallo-hydrolase [Microbacteriaceae bacterium VKM Ac-2854]|nr:MBL fold metallo-hydrolase [Microbacteriaceae bacterium VKM Ac-2854]